MRLVWNCARCLQPGRSFLIMKLTLPQKYVISPFVAAVFAAMATTGVLMFFHVKNGSIVTLHEWAGWAFLAAGLVHFLLNAKPLWSYLSLKWGRVSLVCALALILGLVAIGWSKKKGGERRGPQPDTRPTPEAKAGT